MIEGILTKRLSVGAALLTTDAMAGSGTDYAISRSAVDCGGAMFSTGGDYELSCTIGQPDAGQATGGPHTMSAGFWFPLTESDCDMDGLISPFDHKDFVDCFEGPGGAPADQRLVVSVSWRAFKQKCASIVVRRCNQKTGDDLYELRGLMN